MSSHGHSGAERTRPPLSVRISKQVGNCNARLLHVSYVVDTDYIPRCVPYRLVTCDVGLTENVHLSVEWFILLDGFDRFAFGVENSSDRSRAVVLLNVSGNPNVFLAVLHKYGGRTLSFLNHFIDQIEIVVHLCRTRIECRNLLASHTISLIDLRWT